MSKNKYEYPSHSYSIPLCSPPPMQAYGPHFVQKVQHRHILAQNYFSHVPEMAKEFKHKVQDLPLPRSREKTIVVTMGKVGGAQEGRRTEEEGRAEEDPSQEGEQSRGDCEPPTKELETA